MSGVSQNGVEMLGSMREKFEFPRQTLFSIGGGDIDHRRHARATVASDVLGVPPDWDGTGATAQIDVFAVDQPLDFDGGVFGVGFGIGPPADGGPARNPLLSISYQALRAFVWVNSD
jgi:hypothetical protein